MRKLVLPAAFAALLAGSGAALAADATGTIKEIDSRTAMVTLDNNTSYLLPASIKPTDLKVGAKVKVTFTVVAGMNMVSQVTPQ
ncbi:MAG: DUF1344 domain-containing protein [Bauldia sp.]